MMRKLFFFLLLGTMIFPAAAMARFQPGDYTLTLSGTGSSDNDFDNNDFSLQAGLGYFFNDNMEALIRQQLDITVRDGADDDWNGSTALAADFYLDLDLWQPFIGAAIGYRYGDSVDETAYAGPEAGLRAFVNDTTFVQALVQYQWFFDSSDEVEDNFDDGSFLYGLGLGFRW